MPSTRALPTPLLIVGGVFLLLVALVGIFGGLCLGENFTALALWWEERSSSSSAASSKAGQSGNRTRQRDFVDHLHVERGVLTCYDDALTDASHCVVHSVLAHAPRTAWSSRPRAVSLGTCERVRRAAGVRLHGNLEYDEIDNVLRHLNVGVLLLDVSLPGAPWLGRRDPGHAPTCALVLQVSAGHWEPIAHHGSCVLREWEHAMRVARVITCAPRLVPELVAPGAGSRFGGAIIGDGLPDQQPKQASGSRTHSSGAAPPPASADPNLADPLLSKGSLGW